MFSAHRYLRRAPTFETPESKVSGRPPFLPVASGGLSGRPRCRIFPLGRSWILQLETDSGWLAGEAPIDPPPRLKFPTLSAAVGYAVLHGFDYRIIKPGPVALFAKHRLRDATPRHNNTEH